LVEPEFEPIQRNPLMGYMLGEPEEANIVFYISADNLQSGRAKLLSSVPDVLNRRYQVFVSSTFTDLKDERQHVMQALLKTLCIPTGMELFPASNAEQWRVIERVIDDCDYFIVIVAGKYGTADETTGLSFTEREFDFAVKIGKPILAFYHRNLSALRSDHV